MNELPTWAVVIMVIVQAGMIIYSALQNDKHLVDFVSIGQDLKHKLESSLRRQEEEFSRSFNKIEESLQETQTQLVVKFDSLSSKIGNELRAFTRQALQTLKENTKEEPR